MRNRNIYPFRYIFLGVVIICTIGIVQVNGLFGKKIVAERIIYTYLDAEGLSIEHGSAEYKTLMRKIIWGELPDLTGEGSIYIRDAEELDAVLDYAWEYSGYQELYGGYKKSQIKKAIP